LLEWTLSKNVYHVTEPFLVPWGQAELRLADNYCAPSPGYQRQEAKTETEAAEQVAIEVRGMWKRLLGTLKHAERQTSKPENVQEGPNNAITC
ncbi:hypothetical protein BaRGS_00019037, partial [Batillaria attramentaria]